MNAKFIFHDIFFLKKNRNYSDKKDLNKQVYIYI